MNNKDFVLPFMLSDHSANGRIVSLNSSLEKIIISHNYPPAIANLLGELLVINCFLGQNLKKDGAITCQIQTNDGMVKLVVSEYIYGGGIRGYAGFEEQNFSKQYYSFNELIGTGKLVVTHESGDEKYQGIIELHHESLTKSFENYLEKSEQIKSTIKIAIEATNIFDEAKISACGIMLKKMPEKSPLSQDDWVRYTHFINSISKEELINTPAEELLNRLFHSDGVLIYDYLKLAFKCRCSKEKMQNALSAIPLDELESLRVDGKIIIKCQFCSAEEYF